ncbi:hypothetical protein BDP27DRAFT_1236851 [Rhodocollybia butyracea]|uniref:NB-ARC domain-containing protein n=1 Tax=Rhodocollybia butyracea TaxID=206335 RepID=A0A9P5TZ41_9AGAR|nr:hypothetical protein BDP27DRAFT_1236851 [Rhodocollybia butyracea]
MPEGWLLIFDNADHGVDLNKYIPRCNHGNILITSRDMQILPLSSLDHPFPTLPDLNEQEAIELLLKSSHEEDSHETHVDIVNALGCQALAVVTAGTYVFQHPMCQLRDYLEVFKQKHDALLRYPLKTMASYELTIMAAFRLSYDFLSPPAQALLQICSLFHHLSIPAKLFDHGGSVRLEEVWKLPGEDEEAVISMTDGLRAFMARFTNEADIKASINELARLSLASYSIDELSISFHPIVHHCAQETIVGHNLADVAMFLLSYATPGYGELSNEEYQFQRKLLPHAHHLCDQEASLPAVYICHKVASIFFSRR